MAEKVQFTNSQMLKWMEYVADMQGVSAEKIKMLNTCSKRRNVLATIATHKRVLIFADSTYPNMLYKCWEAGYGDYEMYFGEGYEPSEMKHCKVSDMMDGNLEGPTVIYIVNENTRESMIFGMKNDNFSSGMVKYVGHEIRAVIMNKLEMDVRDTVLLANAFIVAQKSTIENDIVTLLKVNPKIKFIIYTLELDILADIKYLMKKHGVDVTEVMQIAVSKVDKNGVFVAQPAPWMITCEVKEK